MSKVFYDRSGKAHVIGQKKGKAEPEEEGQPSKKPSKGAVAKKFEGKPHGKPQDKSKKSKPHAEKGERSVRDRDGDRKSKSRGGGFGKPESKGSFVQSAAKDRGGRSDKSKKGGRSGGRGGFKKPEAHPDRKFGKGARGKRSKEGNPNWTTYKGVIDKNKRGSAFLIFDRADLEDVFIPRYYVDQLFHGDRVEVSVSDQGEIEDLKVLAHRFKEIFGRVTLDERENKKSKQKTRTGYLIYERKKAKEEVYIASVPDEVKEGDWVKAELIFGDDDQEGGKHGAISAKISEVIGQTLPASYDIVMVSAEFNLTERHTFEAVKQAESYKLEVPGKDEEGRTDLRHIPFITIDGERARDFDDAVYVENLGQQGYRLWVAIADVSHYVKEGTPLDDEAYQRGTSVYFPERAFHMLPRALSEELCSLKPHVPRLSMAVSIDFGRDGAKGEIQLYDAIIESRRRSTYNEIESEKEDPKHADMFALYRILKVQRHDRGSIDFDFPEAEIILDEKTGDPTDIVVRERQDAHRLIEEFMIAANEAVTEWMMDQKLPFIYRIHDEPSMEAIEKFRKLSKNMGMAFLDRGGIPRPKVLSEFIKTLKGNPAEPVLATALLRSMRQAIYSATYGEHFGLASEGYTHFTSPIRRYPDLVVHRQLRAALHRQQKNEGPLKAEEIDEIQEGLNEIAEHCSYRERLASDAEREAIRFKQIRLMGKHLGKEFDGKVVGLNDRGMYVQLFSPYCEGMVPVESIKNDWYEFREERMMLIGRKTKEIFQIGTPLRIQVVRVDLDARQIEFHIVRNSKEDQE